MNMKTIKEWIEEFEEPYKSMILKNTKKQISFLVFVDYDKFLNMELRSAKLALLDSFLWEDSNEWQKFWQEVYFNIEKYLKPNKK